MQIRALALDAFGTLIQYGPRLAPYSRLVGARGEGAARLPFLTRDVPVATFATELSMEHLLPEIEADLAEELAGLRLFAEVPELLARARRAGLRLAVCSNLAAEYGPAVRSLLPGLDAYILSYEVGVAKPDPAFFQRVCDALGCAPGEVMFSGDSRRCDVDGPQAFGMQARHLDRRGGQSLLDVLADVLLTSDELASIGSAYDALRSNPDRKVSAASVRARLAAAGGQVPDMASIPRVAHPMTVGDLIAALQGLPTTLPVMIPAEGGIDHASAVRVTEAARHQRDWAGTPVGQYRELPDDETTGEPFRAVVIDLDGASP
ncbi:HAD hydrolase-like protein [Burkholderia multivorans]|uniref:HAD family hydrolase n=1 Tax=Burkholderia multivorans TaxID=87883 RepID=UPI001C231FF1|nr:HAD family hydrolase [Burkholderia multivorans]MBU9439544.1 HAD hydrolase-like protein [Burkholderia multivorans]